MSEELQRVSYFEERSNNSEDRPLLQSDSISLRSSIEDTDSSEYEEISQKCTLKHLILDVNLILWLISNIYFTVAHTALVYWLPQFGVYAFWYWDCELRRIISLTQFETFVVFTHTTSAAYVALMAPFQLAYVYKHFHVINGWIVALSTLVVCVTGVIYAASSLNSSNIKSVAFVLYGCALASAIVKTVYHTDPTTHSMWGKRAFVLIAWSWIYRCCLYVYYLFNIDELVFTPYLFIPLSVLCECYLRVGNKVKFAWWTLFVCVQLSIIVIIVYNKFDYIAFKK